jgi:hypothetical protein
MSYDKHVMIFILGSHQQPLSLPIQGTGKVASDRVLKAASGCACGWLICRFRENVANKAKVKKRIAPMSIHTGQILRPERLAKAQKLPPIPSVRGLKAKEASKPRRARIHELMSGRPCSQDGRLMGDSAEARSLTRCLGRNLCVHLGLCFQRTRDHPLLRRLP